MFLLYAVLIGVVLGVVLGGRPDGVSRLEIRWSRVIMAGLLVQIVLFAGPVTERIGALGVPIYVGSTVAVIAAIVVNRAIRGMAVIALGAASNLAAILANGGYMPADPGAMAALGKVDPTGYSNSAVLADPVLAPLTDIFALPPWLPFANVFSVGDVAIGVGVVIVLVTAMLRARWSTVAGEGGPVERPRAVA
jgi:hypothetical protein